MKKLFLILAVMLATTVSAMAERLVTGVVVDADSDEPLIGATVLPVGSKSGVATDLDGQFTLTVPDKVSQLHVSYIGYAAKTVDIKTEGRMFISLEKSDTRLDEVVVTGYGSAKRLGSVVGSVAVVGKDALENVTTSTFVDALQGQVPGLAVYSNSGDPSSVDNSIMIRGVNSLQASNTPLFILDGAPISASLFTTLNPSDIENITVLKDASSVAIYGSRAANGVIVITSKKGKYGQDATVTVRANYGFSQMVSDYVTMMDSKQYMQFRNLVGSPLSKEAQDLINNYNISTNWRDEMFNQSAPTYSLEGVVQGGSERLSYYISLNHYEQTGLIENSDMRRESIRASLDSRVKDWLKLGFNVNLGFTKYQTNSESDTNYSGDGYYIENPMLFARMALPYDSPYYYTFDENGKIVYGERAAILHYSGFNTPHWLYANSEEWNRKVTCNANLYEAIMPIKGLTLRAQQSVDAYDATYEYRGYPYESFTSPMGDLVGSKHPGFVNPGGVSNSYGRSYAFTYTNTAEYIFTIAQKHNFTALLGQESIIGKYHGFGVSVSGHEDRNLMLLDQGTTITLSNVSESISQYVFNSIFFRLNYDFDNRYFLDFVIRHDGSSRFAPNHRWANFPAVGVMWNAKNEKFLQNVTWLDDLKLRLSWGATGNAGIGNYAWTGTLGAYGLPYAGSTAIGVSSPGNDDLTWETVYSTDLGLSFGIFDHLTGTIDFYNNETRDMLMYVPYSITTGVSGATGNICTMRNRGVEVEFVGDVFKSKDWYVGLRAQFAYNQNRITKLFDGSDSYTIPNTGLRYEVGHDAHEFYMVRYVGVDPRDGKQIWLDKDGNETKVFPEDGYVMLGKSSLAPWTGGFGGNVRWKDLSLSFTFNWAAQKYMMNNDKYFTCNSQFGTSYNQQVEMLNMWQKPGDVTDIPAYGEALQMDGDNFLDDASFLRLKNLTLSYSLPKKWMDACKMKNVVLHFTGRNLFTITDFTGYDPEPQSNLVHFQYPNTRQYEFGVDVTF